MEDTLIDSETTRTAVKQDLTEAQALDQLMDALQQSIAEQRSNTCEQCICQCRTE